MANTRTNIIKENEEQAFSQLLPTITVQVSRAQVEQDRKDNTQQFPTQSYTTESDALTLNQPVYRPKLLSEFKKAKKTYFIIKA
jgi:outer membrane protein TolC